MKIVICASVAFSNQIVEVRKSLISAGHEVTIPENVEEYAAGGNLPRTHQELAENKIAGNLIQNYFQTIGQADCILILNYTKKNIENYIGGNTFLEMGFAHVQNIPIYLFNPIPDMAYTDELIAMKHTVLNGDLSKIQ